MVPHLSIHILDKSCSGPLQGKSRERKRKWEDYDKSAGGTMKPHTHLNKFGGWKEVITVQTNLAAEDISDYVCF